MYNWFQKESLPAAVIHQIGQALNYDFHTEFPEINLSPQNVNNNKQEAQTEFYNYPETVSFWKNKYLDLLQSHHSLLSAR